MTDSVLTKHQTKTFGPRSIAGWGQGAMITAEVRYDDSCGNGHNSFAITGEIRLPNQRDCEACGMLHDEIAKAFPELQPFLKWHLCSSDEPMHYVANTLYWLGFNPEWCKGGENDPPNLEYARSTAVWPDMPESMLASNGATKEQVVKALEDRRDDLKNGLRKAVEALGLVY